MRSSMDCTLEDSMVDGLFFCATLTGCSGGVAHLCRSGGVASASRSRNVQHRCQARPALFLGGWVLESGMKVLSLIVLSNHSAFHRWSAQVWRYSSKVDMSFFSILSTTCQSPSACMMNTLMSRLIQAVRKKTAGSHVALRRNISAPVRVTDLVEVSKDAESLVVRTLKKNFWLGVRFFLWVCHKWRTFWPTSPRPGRQPLDGSISLKFVLETRLQSESFDTLDDLLRFRVQKLWSKLVKIFD